jgi:hypothetical protein
MHGHIKVQNEVSERLSVTSEGDITGILKGGEG